jgi:hypothetical protein
MGFVPSRASVCALKVIGPVDTDYLLLGDAVIFFFFKFFY